MNRHGILLLIGILLLGAPALAEAGSNMTDIKALFAAQQPRTLDDAYVKDADFLGAQRGVKTAEDDLAKAKADPDGPALTARRAEERLQQAQATLALAVVNAKLKVYTALTNLLTARCQTALSEDLQQQAALQLEAAKLKRKAGAISEQELAQSADAAAKTASTLTADRSTLEGAELRLQPYCDPPDKPLTAPTELDLTRAGIDRHPAVLKAQVDANEAQRAWELAQGPDTAPLDRTAQERALATAKDNLRQARTTQAEAADSALRRYRAAREDLTITADGLSHAKSALATAEKRFAAGSISRLALLDARVAALQSSLAAQKAVAEAWLAQLGLFQATGGAW